jgi:hypothetical protein
MFAALDGRDRLADAIARAREQVEHGYRAYTTFGCRCDACRAANAAYQRGYAKLRRRRDSGFRAKRARYAATQRDRGRAAELARLLGIDARARAHRGEP